MVEALLGPGTGKCLCEAIGTIKLVQDSSDWWKGRLARAGELWPRLTGLWAMAGRLEEAEGMVEHGPPSRPSHG